MELIEALYRQLHSELVHWCAGMTGDAALAEDLVQEAFLRAMDNAPLLESLRPEQRRAWLYRTVKNRFIDFTRRRGSLQLTDEPEALAGAAPDELDRVETRQLLAALPGEDALLFSLCCLQGYSSREAGRLLGLPPGTVRYRVHAARKRLKKLLEGSA